MPAEPIHRLHKVPDEDQWRRLFAAWRGHLRSVWEHDIYDVPWDYSERTNVGLLASANDKDGGVSMVELPFRRRKGDADEQQESAGRFDLWLARGRWRVFAEAKQVWAPGCTDAQIEQVALKLNEAKAQAHQLSAIAESDTIASVVFVAPSLSWTSTTSAESVLAQLREFENNLWERHDKRSRTFQTSFTLSASEIQAHSSPHRVRPRAFPGVILCGRIHQTGAA